MKELIGSIVATIILVGILFWVFNNPNGIGDGLDKGGANVKEKIISATSTNH